MNLIEAALLDQMNRVLETEGKILMRREKRKRYVMKKRASWAEFRSCAGSCGKQRYASSCGEGWTCISCKFPKPSGRGSVQQLQRLANPCKHPNCDRGGKHGGFCWHHEPERVEYLKKWRKEWREKRIASGETGI